MKKIALFFVAALLCLSVCPCLTACSDSSENTDNPLSIGIPASELSAEEQDFYAKYIADYSEYIKFAFCEFYMHTDLSFYTWTPTIIVDKFYIYDFSQVDSETLTGDEKAVFDLIQKVLNGSRMIVCCGGYWNFYSENTWITIDDSPRIPNMFASNNLFETESLLSLMVSYASFKLPEETRILDFGSKYAFRYQPSIEEAAAFEPNYKTVKPVETA